MIGPVPDRPGPASGAELPRRAAGRPDNTSSDTYDDAVVIDAYLAEGTPDGRSRAETIGNALLYVQAHQSAARRARTHRLRATPLLPPGSIHIANQATHRRHGVGRAGPGPALRGHRQAGVSAGANAIGNWMQANAGTPAAPAGTPAATPASGPEDQWKSTEHNIDLYVLFRLLARESGDPAWSSRAARARRFIVSMWDPGAGRFALGTTNDGVTQNDSSQVEDVNSWSYLALQDPAYAASVDWDVANLGVTAGGYSGVSICAEDRTGVWFEGTAHIADALETQDQPGDTAQAASYLADIAYAQVNGPNADGLGIMASSQDALADCGGGYVYASLHTGTTAWYILAGQGIDPLSGTPISAQQG